jgi:hypothetical protein
MFVVIAGSLKLLNLPNIPEFAAAAEIVYNDSSTLPK